MTDEFCKKCRFHGYGSSSSSAGTCDFLLIVGRRRGCPSGTGCTRRVVAKRTKSRRKDEIAESVRAAKNQER